METRHAQNHKTDVEPPVDVEVIAEEVEIIDIPTALTAEASEPASVKTKNTEPNRVPTAATPSPPTTKTPEHDPVETTHTTPPAEALEIFIGPDTLPSTSQPAQSKPGPFAAFRAFVSRLAPGREKSGKTGVIAKKSGKTTAILKKSGKTGIHEKKTG